MTQHDTVNFDILWSIVQQDLPPLAAELEKVIPQSPP